MKSWIKKLVGGFTLLLFSVSLAFAAQCGPKDKGEKWLLDNFGEVMLDHSEETGVAFFGNCKTGTFTILREAPEAIKPVDQKGVPGWCAVTDGVDPNLTKSKYCSQGI